MKFLAAKLIAILAIWGTAEANAGAADVINLRGKSADEIGRCTRTSAKGDLANYLHWFACQVTHGADQSLERQANGQYRAERLWGRRCAWVPANKGCPSNGANPYPIQKATCVDGQKSFFEKNITFSQPMVELVSNNMKPVTSHSDIVINAGTEPSKGTFTWSKEITTSNTISLTEKTNSGVEISASVTFSPLGFGEFTGSFGTTFEVSSEEMTSETKEITYTAQVERDYTAPGKSCMVFRADVSEGVEKQNWYANLYGYGAVISPTTSPKSSIYDIPTVGRQSGCSYWFVETGNDEDFIGRSGGTLEGANAYKITSVITQYALKNGPNGPECDFNSPMKQFPEETEERSFQNI